MTSPRLAFLFTLPLLLVFVAPRAVLANPIITVVPSIGADFTSYDAYRNNALRALATQAGLPASLFPPGSSTTGPAAYSSVPNGGTVNSRDLVVTDFPSFRGIANPPAPFDNEFGSTLFFGLIIDGNGSKFSIAQLSFNGDATGSGDALDFSFGAGTYDYSDDYVGVIETSPGVFTTVTSGPNTQLVDFLIGRGSGTAFEALLADQGATLQDKIDNGLPATGFQITGTYSLAGFDSTGSATVNVAPIPAPPSVVLLGLGVAGLALRRVRRVRAEA